MGITIGRQRVPGVKFKPSGKRQVIFCSYQLVATTTQWGQIVAVLFSSLKVKYVAVEKRELKQSPRVQMIGSASKLVWQKNKEIS